MHRNTNFSKMQFFVVKNEKKIGWKVSTKEVLNYWNVDFVLTIKSVTCNSWELGVNYKFWRVIREKLKKMHCFLNAFHACIGLLGFGLYRDVCIDAIDGSYVNRYFNCTSNNCKRRWGRCYVNHASLSESVWKAWGPKRGNYDGNEKMRGK